jgi:uncharacterized protein YjbI with pentapeptide repeats
MMRTLEQLCHARDSIKNVNGVVYWTASPDEIKLMYEAGERDFTWFQCDGKFYSFDLSGADFSESDLRSAVFNDAILSKAKFNNADLTGAALYKTTIRYAELRTAGLSGAILEYAIFNRSDMRGATLNGARLAHAQMSSVKFQKASFRGSELRRTWLARADLTEADFTDADLRHAEICEADLTGAKFYNADLEDADLKGANLTNADLTGANIRGVKFADAILTDIKGILNPADWILEQVACGQLEQTAEGIVAYKQFVTWPQDQNYYKAPDLWDIQPGTEFVQEPNLVQTGKQGGLDVTVKGWTGYAFRVPIWRVLIRWVDLAQTVVPYHTQGEFRTGRFTTLNILPF